MNLVERIRRFCSYRDPLQPWVFTKRGQPVILNAQILAHKNLVAEFSSYCAHSELSWYWWADETLLVYYLKQYDNMLPEPSDWQSWPKTTNGRFLLIDETSRLEFETVCLWRDPRLLYKGMHILVCAYNKRQEKQLPGTQTIQEMKDFREGVATELRAIVAKWYDGDVEQYWLPKADPEITARILEICKAKPVHQLDRMSLWGAPEGVLTFDKWLEFPRDPVAEAVIEQIRNRTVP